MSAGTEITVAGACHHMPLSGPVTDREAWVTVSGAPGHPEGALLLGETLAHGPVRLDSGDPAFWDAVALAASRIAGWLRNEQAVPAAEMAGAA